jgi:SAM-dependent methyltransferase
VGLIQTLKEKYEIGSNIILYLQDTELWIKDKEKCIEIAYDLQAGSYTKSYKLSPNIREIPSEIIASIISKQSSGFQSILEIGVGEANSLGLIIKKLGNMNLKAYGFDISHSRLLYGKEFLKSIDVNANLFAADLFDIPLSNNSIDIVYTFHSLESNGGKENEFLDEIYRIANKYIFLFEPIYEFGSIEARERMDKFGYIKNLYNIISKKGWKVIKYDSFPHIENPLNPTGIIVIEKNPDSDYSIPVYFRCLHELTPLNNYLGGYYTTDMGGYYYPILKEIPILRKQAAILSTRLSEFS